MNVSAGWPGVHGIGIRRWLAWLASAMLLAVLAHPAAAQAPTAKRVALVVGNATYEDAPLKNPTNDAQALSGALRRLGFEVTTLTNRNRSDLTKAIRDFGRSAAGADAALFYFAGHGVQVRGKNYLLPVGQRFRDEADVETDAVDVNTVLARLEEAGARVSLLILDACRTNPLQRSGRAVARGLARMEAPSGALVAFAAQPGAEAQDGEGSNGVYTRNLLRHIETPGLTVEQMFKRVRADVEGDTARRQSPREESSLTGADFYFVSPFGRVDAAQAQRIEDEAWAQCRNATGPGPCRDYLASYLQGRYTSLARTRLRELEELQARSAPPPVPAEQPTGSVFRDCVDCPQMVVLPQGRFAMGSPSGEAERRDSEGPVHEVTVGYRLAVGKFEVSRGEFERFVQTNGYRTEAEQGDGCFAWDGKEWKKSAQRNWRNPGFEQGDSHPVVCVSWNDVQAYVKWLKEKTGKGYRLLSEAEWEYAARGGQGGSRYPWGDDAGNNLQCGYANGADATAKAQVPGITWTVANCSDGYAYTAPGEALKPNAFGLHHMHGNAWEWVQDVWHDNYSGAPADGSAWVEGGVQVRRVLRGGTWTIYPGNLRSAYRNRYSADDRLNSTGFRIARTL